MGAPRTRRALLGGCGAVGIGLAASALGADGKASPSETINLGMIGVGPMGTGHLRGFSARPGVTIRAICDVNRRKLDAAIKFTKGSAEGTGDPTGTRSWPSRPHRRERTSTSRSR